MTTVTPRIVFVSGPLARNSATMAMADDGDRATRITPVRSEMAIRVDTLRSFMTGNQPLSRYMASPPREKVTATRQMVTQQMLRYWERNSFRTSSLPAASAMIDKAIWFTKPNWSTIGRARTPRMSGPARNPAAR